MPAAWPAHPVCIPPWVFYGLALAEYRHLHPTRAAEGTWSTPVDLPKAGGYRVFADFKPTGERR